MTMPNAPTTATVTTVESSSAPLGGAPASPPATPPPPASNPPATGAESNATPATPPAQETPKPEKPRVPFRYATSAEDIDKAMESGKGNAVLPQSAMKRIKDQFLSRGKEAAQKELQTQLEKYGYKSLDEAFAAMSAAQKAASEAASGKGEKPSVLRDKAVQEAQAKAAEASKRAAAAERRRQEAIDKAEQERADYEMKISALDAGIKRTELDYVLTKVREHIGSLDDAALEQFANGGMDAWFNALKQEKPYLFQSVMAPASTAPAATSSPQSPPAQAPSVTNASAGANTVDAKSMSRQEFQEHLRKKYGYSKSGAAR